MIARATNATRVALALARPQSGLFYLPPFPIALTLPSLPSLPFIPLSAALRRNGAIWFIASAVVFAIIVAPVVQQKIRKQATHVPDMSRYDTVVYRDSEQRLRFDERWGQMTVAFAPTEPDVANAVQTIQVAKTNYRPDELVFAPAFGDTASFGRFSLASLPAEPAERTVLEDPAEQQALARMDDVERYLWEVYQRAPTKKDKSGEFTWKDPAAATRFGISMPAYVISGMDTDFREQLYHMGKAMDAAGVKWAILSAFRDDYRQSLASGYKASPRNSLHGGSRRTGGYGHGRAVDVTGADGDADAVWDWIDENGAKYGLHRPMPDGDPPHVQSKGDWRKLAHSLKETRTRLARTRAPGETDKTKVVAAASR